MDNKIDVLDHGFIRLIDSMGSDLSIVRSARVSYDADSKAGEDEGSDSRLINYLYNNNHNTPFESVTFTFDIKLPIFVTRQWHRHRTQSYNELSARYRQLPAEFYIPEPHLIGFQSPDNKQMRETLTIEEYNKLTDLEKEVIEFTRAAMQSCNEAAFEFYQTFIEAGIPKELARSVLPVATYTHMFATMNLHNLFGFLRERLHTRAQYEIQQYAEAIVFLIYPIVPVATDAFIKSLNPSEYNIINAMKGNS